MNFAVLNGSLPAAVEAEEAHHVLFADAFPGDDDHSPERPENVRDQPVT